MREMKNGIIEFIGELGKIVVVLERFACQHVCWIEWALRCRPAVLRKLLDRGVANA